MPGFYAGYDGEGDRNYIQRPPSFANDMTLTKAFKIKENHAFELRAAFYNAFNQVRREFDQYVAAVQGEREEFRRWVHGL